MTTQSSLSLADNSELLALRQNIRARCRSDEKSCVADLISEWQTIHLNQTAVATRAHQLVTAVRRQRQGASGVDHLMQEFSLSSDEGVALMCLAEALLRIPDAATMNQLIRDKISRGHWQAHLKSSNTIFVNAATWGLMITGKLVSSHSEKGLAMSLSNLITKGGEPIIRKGVQFAMKLLGEQFVMGENIDAAIKRSQENIKQGYTHSFDMLGEAAMTSTDAEAYYLAYEEAIHAIGRSHRRGSIQGSGISIKLSALHPRFCRSQQQRVTEELYPRLLSLCALARDYEIGVNIDAEESERLDLTLDLIERLVVEPLLAHWAGLGFVVQAYQKRAPWVIQYLATLAKMSHRRMMIRLVKGAYWDSEIKRAQVEGLSGYPVYTRKAHTDLSYLVCAHRLLSATDKIYPQFATHNAQTVACIVEMAAQKNIQEYEFQCLHGMGEALYHNVIGKPELGGRCRIYAPVGSHKTLLPYLVRRLLENGANSSFVNRVVDEKVSISELIADPLSEVMRSGGTPHPKIPVPSEIFGSARKNSVGFDLHCESQLNALEHDLISLNSQQWEASPILASASLKPTLTLNNPLPSSPVLNPADRHDVVGSVREASALEIEQALKSANDYGQTWLSVPNKQKAWLLRQCADHFEANRSPLISLCIREAGKTWGNAVAEIRETVDFCRYYAQQIEMVSVTTPKSGVALCISPWNFPLAIFVGQVTAALAAGYPVIAKPAEQTPLIAAFAVRLMIAAGIPVSALQLLPGQGETVGAALTANHRVRTIIFTGSCEVAQVINRCLAQRPADLPSTSFIAETGGQNALIVDSSALPEQVVQDVISSGFDSAGQRCSALRILCLQEDIADHIIAMLRSTLAELRIGLPAALCTDIGPVIDPPAKDIIDFHIEKMRAQGHAVFSVPAAKTCAQGHFVMPTLIEINHIDQLEREIFGPVIHVLRYSAEQLDRIVDDINATGYGLTFGIHSRIDENIDRVTRRIHAGNIYVNRNIVGAVVGVQPFGGHGKSGTGPKAGGPWYLFRLLQSDPPPLEQLGLALTDRSNESDHSETHFAAFCVWLKEQNYKDVLDTCQSYGKAKLTHVQCELSGAIGETNVLRFNPKGKIGCWAATTEGILKQVAAVLATGNTPILTIGFLPDSLIASLPQTLEQHILRVPDMMAESIQAVLFEGSREDLRTLRCQLAQHKDELVPVIDVNEEGYYPQYRLLNEQLISVNTTAAGGNTTLMTMCDTDVLHG